MRFGLVLSVIALLLGPASAARAHLADEFPQVTVQVAIGDEAVDLIVNIPAKDAKLAVFDGLSPVEMDRMEPADLSAVVSKVFAERCPVAIDGVVVPPVVLGAVVGMSSSRQPARRFPEAQVLAKGTLKFFARYETKGPPGRVSIGWSIYANEYDADGKPIHAEEDLQVVAVVSEAGREQVVLFAPQEPGYTWHSGEAIALPEALLNAQPVQRNFINVPVPSIVLVLAGLVCGAITLRQSKPRAVGLVVFSLVAAGACLPYGNMKLEHTSTGATPSSDEALAIFESLHRNIYRAFDYTDEGAVYDALAQSVDGPMLETIYNDVYQSLILREENGAVSKVVRVEIEEAKLTGKFDSAASTPPDEELGSFVVHASWQVDGLVTHFGHAHKRTNAFEAVYTVAPRAAGWRIVEVDILDQRRIDNGGLSAGEPTEEPGNGP
ncbi:MAG: hypothetical protein KTR15_13730 [Phycisphaeraceae bacterium]|nr:hypothetical protein [Phycisphaeraceae bacterium]